MPRIAGLSEAERQRLAGELQAIATRPGADLELANRATWLWWHLIGFTPKSGYRAVWDGEKFSVEEETASAAA